MTRKRLLLSLSSVLGSAGLVMGTANTALADSYVNILTASFQVYATGYCLDSNTNGLGGGVGAVYTLKCNGGNYQKWTVQQDTSKGGYYRFVDNQTLRCLTNDGGKVYAIGCINGSDLQLWSWYQNNKYPSGWKMMIAYANDNALDANGAGVNCVSRGQNFGTYQTWGDIIPV